MALLLAPLTAASDTSTVHNNTSNPIAVVFIAAGCAGYEAGYPGACTSRSVAAGQSTEYTWPGGTSGRVVGASCLAHPSGIPWATVNSTSVTLVGEPTCTAGAFKTATVAEGSWGSWRPQATCPDGWTVVGGRQRVEPDQGKGDDTALNSVQFRCRNPTPTYKDTLKLSPIYEERDITSFDGYWGTWSDWRSCPSGASVTGARMKIEPNQGGGDDSGGNDVELKCTDGTTLGFGNGGRWGTWGDWVSCSTKVIGLAVRVEDSLAAGDDTAMNGLKLVCQ